MKNKPITVSKTVNESSLGETTSPRRVPSLQSATKSYREHFDTELKIKQAKTRDSIFAVTNQDQSRNLIDALRDEWHQSWQKIEDRDYAWSAQELLECLTEMKYFLRLFLQARIITQEQFDMTKNGVVTVIESWLTLISHRDGESSMTIQIRLKPRLLDAYYSMPLALDLVH